jgi:hypothetical protein
MLHIDGAETPKLYNFEIFPITGCQFIWSWNGIEMNEQFCLLEYNTM